MNIDAYFARIGYSGARTVSRDTLAAIVLRHTQAIPFENIDAFTGVPVSLVPQDVERKLVHDGRGGWCFEQNLLLSEALRALGFEVTDLAGRVLWNRPADAVTARTHRLLAVRAEGREWLADVGFGGQMPTGVLDLHSEAEQATPHEPFRLRRSGEYRVVEALVRGAWLPLYRFDMHPQLPIDFEAANYQLAHDPASHFTQTLGASRAVETGRWVLRGHELGFHRLGGETERRDLHSVDEILAALCDPIGVNIGRLTELPRRLQRWLDTAS